MSDQTQVFVFGEVLFDCFPTGEQVLGGAPFNVAWHLQALGNQPAFISSVGDDKSGKQILAAMRDWSMDTTSVQIDSMHPTGQVEVKVVEGEPDYTITSDCAYDFINTDALKTTPTSGILYHGTLGLRQTVSRKAFIQLAKQPDLSIFLDVNLRSPWWQTDDVYGWMKQASWVKLNQDELQQLGFSLATLKQAMIEIQSRFNLKQLIVTRGEKGALVLSGNGEFHSVVPEPVKTIVDTVGAGDAFSAIFIHGLVSGWTVSDTLTVAQQFASQVIGLRGATSTDPAFYQGFID
jgi:fructokinase